MRISINNLDDVFKSTEATVKNMELKGYEFITNLFADSSGLGASDEPALTPPQLMERLKELISEHGTIHSFITEAGQFQVNIGIYKALGKRRTRVIANNTLKVFKTTACKELVSIRLHDTDIVTFLPGNKIRLNNGGWKTPTTKKRIQEWLPEGYNLYQKNWEWLIDTPTGTIKYKNGMEI